MDCNGCIKEEGKSVEENRPQTSGRSRTSWGVRIRSSVIAGILNPTLVASLLVPSRINRFKSN